MSKLPRRRISISHYKKLRHYNVLCLDDTAVLCSSHKMKQRRSSYLFLSTSLLLAVLYLRASQSSPIISDQRFSLQCLQNFMLLEMDLKDIPKLEPSSLHLRHFSCRPDQVMDTRAIFRVPFQGCGTTQGTESDYIVFKNVVDNTQEFNATRVSVRHAPELRYSFACRYRQKYFLTLQEGETGEHTNKNEQGKESSTKEDVPEDVTRSQSSVSCLCLHCYLSLFLFGLHLLL